MSLPSSTANRYSTGGRGEPHITTVSMNQIRSASDVRTSAGGVFSNPAPLPALERAAKERGTVWLPLTLSWPPSWIRATVLWLPYILIYELVNRFPVRSPTALEFSIVDRAIPFLPVLLPIYVGYIPFFWWTGIRSPDRESLSQFFYCTYFQILVCCAVWVLYPVTMPRELFYGGATYNLADTFWRWFDAPNNCFPSLHAANCFLFIQFNWRLPARGFHTLIALAIVASTMLVKQHYVIDVVAGGGVSLLTMFFASRIRFQPE